MVKTAVITVELVPEAALVDVADLKKEITKSLQSDWLLKVLKVELTGAGAQES